MQNSWSDKGDEMQNSTALDEHEAAQDDVVDDTSETSRSIDVPNEVAETVIADLSSTEFKVLFKLEESIYDGSTKVIFGPGVAADVDEAVAMLGEHIEDLMSSVDADAETNSAKQVQADSQPQQQHQPPVQQVKAPRPRVQARPKMAAPVQQVQAPRPQVQARPKMAAQAPRPQGQARPKMAEPSCKVEEPVLSPEVLDPEADEVATEEEPDTEPDAALAESAMDAEEGVTSDITAEGTAAPAPVEEPPARVGLNSPSSDDEQPDAPEVALLLPTTAAATGSEASLPREATGPAGKMTVEDWLHNQDQFDHLGPLPQNWIRIKSSHGDIYYMNIVSGKTSMDKPTNEDLPRGWEKVVSRSTGGVYYRNIDLGLSQFEVPL